jgi:hypothetical protein
VGRVVSRFRPRRGKQRRHKTAAEVERERWLAERYRPHSVYSAKQVRQILVEDACNRWPTPLGWFGAAVDYIAIREMTTSEKVFQEVRTECIARTGRDMPMAGVI